MTKNKNKLPSLTDEICECGRRQCPEAERAVRAPRYAGQPFRCPNVERSQDIPGAASHDPMDWSANSRSGNMYTKPFSGDAFSPFTATQPGPEQQTMVNPGHDEAYYSSSGYPSPVYQSSDGRSTAPSSRGSSTVIWDHDGFYGSPDMRGRGTPSSVGSAQGLCSDCNAVPCNDKAHRSRERAKRKNQNECCHRTELQCQLHIQENILLFAGVKGLKLQSRGNARSSGLEYTKADIEAVGNAQYAWLLQKTTELAINEGTEEVLAAKLQELAELALTGRSPYLDTFMYDDLPGADNRPCEHEKEQKACTVHDHDDWKECRRTRMDAIISRKKQRYRQRCKQELRLAQGRHRY